MPIISERFTKELRTAGLAGLPFSWGEDGSIEFNPSLTQSQINAINAVLAAHDGVTPLTSAEIEATNATSAEAAFTNGERMIRLNFEVNFDQENRIRTLAGQPTITKAQYRAALVNIYKALP